MGQKASLQCIDFDQGSHSLFYHTWFFGKYRVTAGCKGVDRNSMSHCKGALCLISFPQFC